MAKKISITRDGYLELITQVYESKLEERELALDRYRSADEQMETAEQFVLMGKNAVSFLSLAANSSTDLASLAKEIKSIVYKDGDGSGSGQNTLSEDFKSTISEQIEEMDREKKTKPNLDED